MSGPIAAAAQGQGVQVQVAKQQLPYYIGQPVVIQFTVHGFDQQPTPTVALEQPATATRTVRGQMASATPSVFSQMISRNGRVSRSTTVSYRINYVVTADAPGDYQVGPFVIKQGTKEARVAPVTMSFEAVPEDPNMRIRLILPKGNLYCDQRVPVEIEWSYAGNVESVRRLSIYSPLFDQFRFAPDSQPTRGGSRLPIDTKSGRLLLPAEATTQQRDGKTFIVLRAKRTLIPDRVGQFALAPITATLERTTAWSRQRGPTDDFGFGSSFFRDLLEQQRRPVKTALSRAVGQPQTLVVNPFPVAGRPESFAGAVGTGFSIDVAADRTVVRVGDPISLHITLRGKGNLENASLPPLSADHGMSLDQFRLPTGDLTGSMADGSKHFDVSVRVLDQSVTEIPSLAYSWFDPSTETYQTVRSKPIALRVMPAQVVSARDVVGSPGGPRQPTSPKVSPASGPAGQGGGPPTKSPTFSLSGADLAIELTAAVVLRDARNSTSVWLLQFATYAVGLLLIVVAWADRKRKDIDPAVVAMRKNIRRQQTRIAQASRLTRKEAAREIADAMRMLVAELPDVARAEAQAVIAECETIAFAPAQTDTGQLDATIVERAAATAAQFAQAAGSAKCK